MVNLWEGTVLYHKLLKLWRISMWASKCQNNAMRYFLFCQSSGKYSNAHTCYHIPTSYLFTCTRALISPIHFPILAESISTWNLLQCKTTKSNIHCDCMQYYKICNCFSYILKFQSHTRMLKICNCMHLWSNHVTMSC